MSQLLLSLIVASSWLQLKEGAGVAQVVSARLSEQEVPGSILDDFNVCFDFPLIRVAVKRNTDRGRG